MAVEGWREVSGGHVHGARRLSLSAGTIAVLLSLAGCAVNPATGGPAFTPFMSLAEEARIGREQHPKILEEFGGAYADPALQKYVASIGGLLAKTSELPYLPFTFTVLNSDVVNAFALPGGYVYVTRGLLALANNEAELAGVLAHEIGHVTARHAAQRYSHGIVAGLGAAVLGALSGERVVSDLLKTGAELYVRGYSREQEFEADTLGIRYLARAGYDTRAMASFLSALAAHARLEAALLGKPGEADRFALLSTHPRTADRVVAAAEAAGVRPAADPMVARDVYFKRIDGLLYGDDPEQGIVLGRTFAHPRLRFRFEVPRGFLIRNGETEITAAGPPGTLIVFDADRRPYGGTMFSYLVERWARGARLAGPEPLSVPGLEAAAAMTRLASGGGPVDAWLVAIRFDPGTIYRFVFLSRPDLTLRAVAAYRGTALSFRRLSEEEAAGFRPKRIRVVTVGPGETATTFAPHMPVADRREEWFRILNGLAPGEEPRAGELVKTIGD